MSRDFLKDPVTSSKKLIPPSSGGLKSIISSIPKKALPFLLFLAITLLIGTIYEFIYAVKLIRLIYELF